MITTAFYIHIHKGDSLTLTLEPNGGGYALSIEGGNGERLASIFASLDQIKHFAAQLTKDILEQEKVPA